MSALALQSFGFEEQLVRALDQDGVTWFVAQDVCSCLDLVNTSKYVASLEDDEKGITNADTLGGKQDILIVSESGMYALAFKSKKPKAIRFRKWVTSDVIPAIRKTGSYSVANDDEPEDDAPMVLPFMETVEDLDRLRVGIALIRETRMLYGRGKARRLWPVLGLPSPPPRNIGNHGVVSYIRDESVARWISANLEPAAGNRAKSNELWADYQAYCEEENSVPSSRVAFGRTLNDFGYPPFKSCIVYRMGCRLIH